jgi:hypothetical protein
VERDARALFFGECDAPRIDEPHDEVGMVDHLVVAAELGILVLQHVEAVRARRDDLLHAAAVER